MDTSNVYPETQEQEKTEEVNSIAEGLKRNTEELLAGRLAF